MKERCLQMGGVPGTHGIPACCSASCGQCGGQGCQSQPGELHCCAGAIERGGKPCGTPPCAFAERLGALRCQRERASKSRAAATQAGLTQPAFTSATAMLHPFFRDRSNSKEAQAPMPKHVWQTARSADLPPELEANRARMIAANPAWQFHLFDDEAMRTTIRRMPSYIGRAFASLLPGAARADLWRYCQLYLHGGVYLDIDAGLVRPLDTWLSANQTDVHGAVLATERTERSALRGQREGRWPHWHADFFAQKIHGVACIHHVAGQTSTDRARHRLPQHMILQWALAFSPRHDLLAVLIDEVARHTLNWREDGGTPQVPMGDKVVWLTGPAALTVVVHRMAAAGQLTQLRPSQLTSTSKPPSVGVAPSSVFRLAGWDYDGSVTFRQVLGRHVNRSYGALRYTEMSNAAPLVRRTAPTIESSVLPSAKRAPRQRDRLPAAADGADGACRPCAAACVHLPLSQHVASRTPAYVEALGDWSQPSASPPRYARVRGPFCSGTNFVQAVLAANGVHEAGNESSWCASSFGCWKHTPPDLLMGVLSPLSYRQRSVAVVVVRHPLAWMVSMSQNMACAESGPEPKSPLQ